MWILINIWPLLRLYDFVHSHYDIKTDFPYPYDVEVVIMKRY